MLVYRAETINGVLVEGYYYKTSKAHYIHPFSPPFGYVEIKYDTLAVHHPEMMASESNRLLKDGTPDLRIFLALVKNRGDLIGQQEHHKRQIMFTTQEAIPYFQDWGDYNIYGIDDGI